MDTLQTIKDILEEQLDIESENVNEDSTFDSLGIDSLDSVEVFVELDDRLDISLGNPEGLETIGDLIEYIENL